MNCPRSMNHFRTSFVCLSMLVLILVAPAAWATNKFTTLHRFRGGKDGKYPWSGVAVDAARTVYGTTTEGGAYGLGVAFELKPQSGGGWKETVLHNFKNNGVDGMLSAASLILDQNGNLYGTAYYGGSGNCTVYQGFYPGCGVVFELSPAGNGTWKETILYNFVGGTKDGAYPASKLTMDASGNLFGTTSTGGSGPCTFGNGSGCGTVFELSPSGSGWTESVLYSFHGNPDGQFPSTGLVEDVSGNFYGFAAGGSSNCPGGCGVVYQLSSVNGDWKESVLYSFTSRTDGLFPNGEPVLDNLGHIYGATKYGGGVNGSGTIFELVQSSGKWSSQTLHTFCLHKNCPDGAVPVGAAMDPSGNLYGVTTFGGTHGSGVIYKMHKVNETWKETIVHNFQDHPGSEPQANVILSGGTLYGTTQGDTFSTFGSVYQLIP